MTPYKLRTRKKRWYDLHAILKERYGEPYAFLDHDSNWQLLIAVILSAQTTDEQVNKVTPGLFKEYPNPQSLGEADEFKVQKLISSINYYKAKARYIISCSKSISENFNGEVPDTIENLTTLSGVGRKTANVVLSEAFNNPQGIAVDTHVKRFAYRYNLSDRLDPNKIEQDLIKIIPQEQWREAPFYMIRYGRDLAPARKYDTSTDPLVSMYKKAGKVFNYPS